MKTDTPRTDDIEVSSNPLQLLKSARTAVGVLVRRLVRRCCPHDWATTHTNGWYHPSQQVCTICGAYRHKVYRSDDLPQWPRWKPGKHPASGGCGTYSSLPNASVTCPKERSE
jgi:hypothetical protein